MKKLILVLALALGIQVLAVPTTVSLVTTSLTSALIADNTGDTANGDRFLNPNCDAFLIARNTHGTNASTVTITAQSTSAVVPGIGPVTRGDITMSLAAGDVEIVGPLKCKGWNDSSGYVQVTYAGTGTPKISPIRLNSTYGN